MPILELSPMGFYMAYMLLYEAGVISGIGERSDHFTVTVELATHFGNTVPLWKYYAPVWHGINTMPHRGTVF